MMALGRVWAQIGARCRDLARAVFFAIEDALSALPRVALQGQAAASKPTRRAGLALIPLSDDDVHVASTRIVERDFVAARKAAELSKSWFLPDDGDRFAWSLLAPEGAGAPWRVVMARRDRLDALRAEHAGGARRLGGFLYAAPDGASTILREEAELGNAIRAQIVQGLAIVFVGLALVWVADSARARANASVSDAETELETVRAELLRLAEASATPTPETLSIEEIAVLSGEIAGSLAEDEMLTRIVFTPGEARLEVDLPREAEATRDLTRRLASRAAFAAASSSAGPGDRHSFRLRLPGEGS